MSSYIYLALSTDGLLKLGFTTQDLKTCLRIIAYDHAVSMMLVGAQETEEKEIEERLHYEVANYRIIVPHKNEPSRTSKIWYPDVPHIRELVKPWKGELIIVKYRNGASFQVQFESGLIKILNRTE